MDKVQYFRSVQRDTWLELVVGVQSVERALAGITLGISPTSRKQSDEAYVHATLTIVRRAMEGETASGQRTVYQISAYNMTSECYGC